VLEPFANKSFERFDAGGDVNIDVLDRCGDDVDILVFVTRLVVLGRWGEDVVNSLVIVLSTLDSAGVGFRDGNPICWGDDEVNIFLLVVVFLTILSLRFEDGGAFPSAEKIGSILVFEHGSGSFFCTEYVVLEISFLEGVSFSRSTVTAPSSANESVFFLTTDLGPLLVTEVICTNCNALTGYLVFAPYDAFCVKSIVHSGPAPVCLKSYEKIFPDSVPTAQVNPS